MPDIINSIFSTEKLEDDCKYIDFTKYFKVINRDFSDIKIHSDSTETILEIYRSLNGDLPFCKNCHIKDADRVGLYEFLKKEQFGIISSFIPNHNYLKKDSIMVLAGPKKDILIVFDEVGENIGAKVFYQQSNKKHSEIIEKLIGFEAEEKPGGKIHILLKEYGELNLSQFNVKKQDVDFDNYNDDFRPAYEKTVEFLNNDKSGILLLHGEAGTGKTSFIRSLTELTERGLVYTTRNIAEVFDSPDFLAFAVSKLKGKCLILEDVESVLQTDGVRSSATTNILGLSDGLLSDLLNLKIIASFNTDLDKIDPAICRRGRMVLRYEFKKLTLTKTNNLLKKLGANPSKEELTLAEIYNQAPNEPETDSKKKFGF